MPPTCTVPDVGDDDGVEAAVDSPVTGHGSACWRRLPGRLDVMIPTAVLFDFGSTLFAHEPLADTVFACAQRRGAAIDQSWARGLAERINVAAHTPDQLARGRDLSAAVWFEQWHELYSLADDEVPGLGAAVFEAMHAAHEWVPYASTIDTLRVLDAADVPVGVVSNTGWDIRAVFEHHGLLHTVRHFSLSYEFGDVKPAAGIFLAACAALGKEPGDVLMVGDDPTADSGAAWAGVRTLLLPALPAGDDNGLDIVTQMVACDASIRA